MKRFFLFILLLSVACLASVSAKEVKIKLVETSDIHGNFFPYNFIKQEKWGGSLARVCSFVEEARHTYGDRLILVDNGDILQGQPSVYYYNYMDTQSEHLCASVMNYMKYDAGNMGNHDVEAGRAVFERWIKDCDFPVLGANVIDKTTGKPLLKPYQVIERGGVKVAILGMITPAIPIWLPETLWKGLTFADMEETARQWMQVIREKEKPDLIVGVFHAGDEARTLGGLYREDASEEVACRVPGFDVVMMGHNHRKRCQKIVNCEGDSVLLINPASNGRMVGDVDVTFRMENGKVVAKQVTGALTEIDDLPASEAFLKQFAPQYKAVEAFVSRKIGSFSTSITTRPAYFGPSAFIDLIHCLQLAISKADISFAAPLSFDAEIKQGDVTVGDMFNLYKFENMLYTMSLTGAEIKGFLEESYAMWTNQMKSADDHILLVKEAKRGEQRYNTFVNFSFNFDSAAGIEYTVDVTKPKGEKITILRMADGSPFDMNKRYKVALNSYRGNGGGELLTKGAGIPQEKLSERILTSTDKDLRYYLIQYIEKEKVLNPSPLNQWKFIPEEWVKPASERDYEFLFGN